MGYVLKFFFRFLHFIVQPSMGLEQGSVSWLNLLCFQILHREQPIWTTRAQIFEIDRTTKTSWIPCTKQTVSISFYHDPSRQTFRIISVEGSKVSSGRQIRRILLLRLKIFTRFLCGNLWLA
jgi:hypothetical protein